MKKTLCVLLLIVFSLICFGQQDTLIIKGIYMGKNIFIQNPLFDSNASEKTYCIEKIIINGQETTSEIDSNAIEIALSSMQIKVGGVVRILIVHKKDCAPKILNLDDWDVQKGSN